jgi:hypothetical protein
MKAMREQHTQGDAVAGQDMGSLQNYWTRAKYMQFYMDQQQQDESIQLIMHRME